MGRRKVCKVKPTGPVFDREWRAACALRPAAKPEVDHMVKRHYIGKWPGVCTQILMLERDGMPLGCIIFALPPRETSKRYNANTWELARLWLEDDIPSNAETFVIGRAIRWLRRNRQEVECLVSYADPSVGHGGTIYRASNWIADGRTDDERKSPRFDYGDARTGRRYSRRSHVPADAEIVRLPRVSKHRFYYRLRDPA